MSNALANKQGQLAPLKKVDPKDVLDRVLSEESTKEIAASLGVTRSALNQWLLINAETEWKAAQYIRAAKRKDEAEEELETAPDALSLARAREKLRAAQWDLERVCRRIYGQDAPPASAAVQINIGIRHKTDTVDAQVIEVERDTADR
jgi:DNA-binding transcriptional regulator YdaS (Cro superfamily)